MYVIILNVSLIASRAISQVNSRPSFCSQYHAANENDIRDVSENTEATATAYN